MTADTQVSHPARFSANVLDAIAGLVDAEAERVGQGLRILDPFAGAGGIHVLGDRHETVGIELEPEWAAMHPDTIVGDATDIDEPDGAFDLVATSPCYGNRMADTYDGRDGSRRMTYRIALGHELTDGSAAGLQWGTDYRRLHASAIREMVRVTRPGGLLIVNMKNHVRDGDVQLVAEWWLTTLLGRGCNLVAAVPVSTPGMRHGANWDLRADGELLLVVRTPERTDQGRLL